MQIPDYVVLICLLYLVLVSVANTIFYGLVLYQLRTFATTIMALFPIATLTFAFVRLRTFIIVKEVFYDGACTIDIKVATFIYIVVTIVLATLQLVVAMYDLHRLRDFVYGMFRR